MSAQTRWKHYYRQIIEGLIVPKYIPVQRDDMRDIRREAALERKLEAAERTIEAQKRRIESLQMTIGQNRLDELVTDRIGYEQ